MPGQRVLVIGASGRTGRLVAAKAVQRGHTLTAFVRDPQRLQRELSVSRVATGDSRTDDEALIDAMQNQDVVITAIGAGDSFKPNGVIAQSVPRVVRAMEAARVKRIIHLSAFGVGDTFNQIPLLPRIFVRTLLKNIYADKLAGESELIRSKLDWTIIYPTGLTDKLATGTYRQGTELELRGFPTISRADLAEFIVSQIGDATYLHKGVLVTS